MPVQAAQNQNDVERIQHWCSTITTPCLLPSRPCSCASGLQSFIASRASWIDLSRPSSPGLSGLNTLVKPSSAAALAEVPPAHPWEAVNMPGQSRFTSFQNAATSLQVLFTGTPVP